MIDTKQIYETNTDFKEYVDKLCSSSNISLEKALELKMVAIIADYYVNK